MKKKLVWFGLIFSIFIQIAFVADGQILNDSAQPVSLKSMTDRIEILDLINNYSHYADRREPQKQAALFTEDAIIEIYHGEPGKNKPDTVLRGRKEFVTGFETLKKYNVTMHFNGQSVIQIIGDSAAGETYCLAHHIWVENGNRMLMVMGIRYYDRFIRINNHWFFSRRKLIFDFIDKRPSAS
jgi:SnoaL-like domain